LLRRDRPASRQAEKRTFGFPALLGAARGARVTLTVKNGKPAFRKLDKGLVKLAGLKRQHLLEHAAVGLDGIPPTQVYAHASDALCEETARRLGALIEHYKLNNRGENTPLMLAFALATDFVPNFDVFNPPRALGRPRTRKATFGQDFRMAVEAKAEKRGKGIADACLQLSKKGERWHRYKSDTLESRYHELKTESEKSVEAFRLNYRGLLAEGLPKPE
jgi:hypothetical protein